ncbi:Elongator complex protein [Vigna angularis]|uniref:Elongator complex protein n=1 Tax=Phaseolus angularis TaxID=3914 RepID=A0A8T0L3S6_PHAAN|nr:Elongator complex protein [Vigna angularis]
MTTSTLFGITTPEILPRYRVRSTAEMQHTVYSGTWFTAAAVKENGGRIGQVQKKQKMEQKNWNLLDESLGLHINDDAKPWPLCGRFVLVEDCVDTSAAFVLHHILKRSFSSHPSSAVLFLAFSHPFSHYDRVLRKLCRRHYDSASLSIFIFGGYLKLVLEVLILVWEDMQLSVVVNQKQDKKSISIIIDDISFLEVAANGSSDDVLNLLHYCHTLTSEYGCALIALDHKDIYLNGDRTAVILEMEYRADILVKAEPLATGLAKDVHGQLMVLNKETQHQHGITAIKSYNFHFKIKENGIECFYPGTKIQ